jgi:hypothetical protein
MRAQVYGGRRTAGCALKVYHDFCELGAILGAETFGGLLEQNRFCGEERSERKNKEKPIGREQFGGPNFFRREEGAFMLRIDLIVALRRVSLLVFLLSVLVSFRIFASLSP